MNDMEIAANNLAGHSLVLCKNGDIISSDKRGISPMLDFISEGRNLQGYSAADTVVGKAAAMLFIKAGIKEVYAKTLSRSGKNVLDAFGIPVSYGVLTDKIINRERTGICPMEQAVAEASDAETAFRCIIEKLNSLK